MLRTGRSQPHNRRTSGFTQVELLTVLGIIAVLAGILFPVFGKTREDSRRSSCAANLHQIGMAVGLYKQDYDGAFPRGVDVVTKPLSGSNDGEVTTNNPEFATIPYLNDLLQPYVHSKAAFACPSDYGIDRTGVSSYQQFGSSYTVATLVTGETDTCFQDTAGTTYMQDLSGEWHTFNGAQYLDFRTNQLRIDGHITFAFMSDSHMALGRAYGGCQGIQ